MLDSTFEIISLAASNSLLVFCFCNLMIVIILAGSSDHSSRFDADDSYAFPAIVVARSSNENSTPLSNSLVEEENLNVIENSPAQSYHSYSDDDDDRDSDDDKDDELRRRAEEFIAKINQGWRDEKLKAHTF